MTKAETNLFSELAEIITIDAVGLSILVFDLNPAQQALEIVLTLVLIIYTAVKLYKLLNEKK